MAKHEDAAPAEAPPGPPGLDEDMARELLAHYLEGAAERLASLEVAVEKSAARPGDPELLDALRRMLHKIAGSAGTYGFPALTRSARQLEQRVAAARASPPGDAALFDAARSFHRQMAAAFELAGGASLKGAAAEAPPVPEIRSLASSAGTRERLVVAVIGDGTFDDAAAAAGAAVGAALAAAGTHLLGAGPEDAARGYRQAGGEGLVLWVVPGTRSSASSAVDLPLSAPTLPAQCAVVSAAADGAIVIGGGGEALAHCGFLLREGKPVVALLGSGGAASVLSGRDLGGALVVAATSAEDAVFELLARLSNAETR